MNRLRILKKRAARSGTCAFKSGKGWCIANSTDHTDGLASKREALMYAARWSLPRTTTITIGSNDGSFVRTRYKFDGTSAKSYKKAGDIGWSKIPVTVSPK